MVGFNGSEDRLVSAGAVRSRQGLVVAHLGNRQGARQSHPQASAARAAVAAGAGSAG